MDKYNRRKFIKTSGGALAAAMTPGLNFLNQNWRDPSDTISVGLIGCRSMGFGLLHHALNQPGVACAGLCDVDQNVLENRASDVNKQTGKTPKLYSDYRKMLEDKDIDAVFIGTPDHWHCLIAIHAMQAGKHVYVEKPLARTIAEGELIMKAAGKYGKVVQVGQHQRSGVHWQEIARMMQAGHLGKIRTVNLWANFDYGQGPERVPDEAVPEGVNYDMWLGPAPKRPFNPNRFHGVWRFDWDYGGGLITDWGAHLFDIPLWALNIQGPPKSVSSIGGIFAGGDRAIDMADTQTVIYEFDDFNMVWEHNGGTETGPYGRNYGIAFKGNNGTLIVNREGWEIIPETEDDKPIIEEVPFQEPGKRGHEFHVANFLDTIRGEAELNCPVEAGYLAAFYGHIGNIAHRTGERLSWDSGTLVNRSQFEHIITPQYRKPWSLPKI
ncbi:Gfo/Idh/MocA family oxidoreductase [Aliifodinibius sp. S!AR15-10]|uniref:Gfo/Idh/MocA family protein n=1 Tax=Aliifodinibius sp. S!AR15-10 TaxID=2950437 RepID=UPI002862DAB6|nr:Gfo/Idh/MocA family oxidoreductase [Aliifodinibius sp. S!AR15-10]MDR8390811.1 Gfo/Idh/MocA family oxidoreductase [Aliifodinibius sp. S!AR15-10]